MDISKTCFRVSLMNFHLENTPNKEDARRVTRFCSKQRELLFWCLPPWVSPRGIESHESQMGSFTAYFQAPQPFQIVLTQSEASDQPEWASWQPHLAGSQILWLGLNPRWSVGKWLMERLLCDAWGKLERTEEFRHGLEAICFRGHIRPGREEPRTAALQQLPAKQKKNPPKMDNSLAPQWKPPSVGVWLLFF